MQCQGLLPSHFITLQYSAGGKWTTYRLMAQDAVDRAVAEGGLKADACSTAHLKLIGSGALAWLLAGPSPCCSFAALLLLYRAARAFGMPQAEPCNDGGAVNVLPIHLIHINRDRPATLHAEGYHPALFTEVAQNYVVPHRPGAIDTNVAKYLVGEALASNCGLIELRCSFMIASAMWPLLPTVVFTVC